LSLASKALFKTGLPAHTYGTICVLFCIVKVAQEVYKGLDVKMNKGSYRWATAFSCFTWLTFAYLIKKDEVLIHFSKDTIITMGFLMFLT
jgi:hypothetical protein